MAEAVLRIVLDQVASIVLVQVKQEVKLVFGVSDDIEHLKKSLTMVQAVLADAETKQVASKEVKCWLQDLKDIMYDTEDVLDKWCTRIAISQSESSGVTTNGVPEKVLSYLSSLCSCFQLIVERHEIGHRIIDIQKRLDKNKESVSQLKLIANLRKEDRHQPRNFTSSITNISEIKGRDSDKDNIIGKLFSQTSNSTERNVNVAISIVGMGGLGKTTLAQLIYNEAEVKEKFHIKMWVCVSELFDRKRLAEEIIQQATGKTVPSGISWELLHKDLSESVEEKRFLLVLDDMWSEDYQDWAPLKNSLDCGAPGSKIVVTARSKKVAKMMGSVYTHELKQLSDEACWSVFQRIAFQGRLQDEVDSLEELGRKLATKCKGVPLAAETLASHMQFVESKDEWRNIELRSDLWEVTGGDAKGLFPVLYLSYQALSPQSKQCFIYTAIYPEDAKIEKDILVKQWMAQGYLGLDGTKELEIIGRQCFDDLAMRSFFQKVMAEADGDAWKMHDLVRQFAQLLAEPELSLGSNGFTSDMVRHISSNSKLENSNICEGSKVRTFIISHSHSNRASSIPNFLELFQQLKCLRALDLNDTGIEEVPDEVGTLSHLRYLDFSKNKALEELPETICNLYNLQTLKLNRCRRFSKLPEGVGRLSNLRHLVINSTRNLQCLPKGIGELSRLRTLSKFEVSEEGTMGELGRLNYLCGTLLIRGLNRVKDEEEVKKAQLAKKEDLRSLELIGLHLKEDDAVRMESVWESLQPNGNLETLEIWEYAGLSFPLWMLRCDSVLPNIVKLNLCNCKCNQLPPALGKLKHLGTLSLARLPLVKDLGDQLLKVSNSGENGASSSSSKIELFPKLRILQINEMVEWEEEMEKSISSTSIMPWLQKLHIGNCPKLKVVPHYMTSSLSGNLDITISYCPQVELLKIEGCVKLEFQNCPKLEERIKTMFR